MASSTVQHHLLLLFFFSIFSLISLSSSSSFFRPRALVLPVNKDGATRLHVATIHKRTPPAPLPFLLHLNGHLLWVNCQPPYLSSTYDAPFCHSTVCSRAASHRCHRCRAAARPRPGCNNNTCAVLAANPVTGRSTVAELALDALSIQSAGNTTSARTRGGRLAAVPEFLFACAPLLLLQGLPKVQGVAGFGPTQLALPSQIASHFGFTQQFIMCLSSSPSANGAIFFGSHQHHSAEISDLVTFTPLTVTPRGEYSITVSAITINEKAISPFNKNTSSLGRVQLCTTTPFTVLERSLFQAFTTAFAAHLWQVRPVETAAPPFRLCYKAAELPRTSTGPRVPNVEFVLHRPDVVWRVLGANSMVEARPGVMCLAIVDGGLNPRAPIVIGAHQLEDNLLQFDLAKSRLGFSSSLLIRSTDCANFNFSSTAANP
ncbi:gamma conglutin 1-like [Diospyros lotus]|uniref:gamma conglutin 1-like n=1 Tax=Diospyros lotus TaxID=55363 RepID=UPI00225B3C21|nr:gamma conglutin 1-like [Diospyros lotus]